MEYKVYNATMVDEDCGLEVVSLVENPAVEVNFFAFNNEQPQELYFRDEVEHCITGVALRADTPIYRNNINGAPGYIVFTRDFIKELVIKYSKDQRLNNVSLNHDGNNVSNCFFYESYIIDEEKGIKPTQFKDIPNGSWVVSFKIDNPDVWEAIVNKDVKGFSIEGLFGFEETKLQKEQSMEEFIDELLFSVSDNKLIKACKEKQVVSITYDDETDQPSLGPRDVVIVAVGMSKADNLVARAYQLNGSHHHNRPKDWDLLRADRIESFKVKGNWKFSDLPFEVNLDINPFGDLSMNSILALAEFDENE